jgi:predicted MPP superfamily phosphohydrolase
MIFLVVFVPSVVLTAVIGLFLALTWKAARSRRALGLYWGAALAVHLLWWRLPDLHGVLGGAGRWLTIVWIGAVIAGVLLIIPFAVAVIGQRFLVARAAARRSPLLAVYAGLSLACGVGVAFGSTGALRVREAEVRINGLPAALDGLRIANLGDVHIGRFSSVEDLADAIEVINGHQVELLAMTGDLIDDLTQLEPALDALERSAARSIVAVLGNHDKMANEKAVVDAYRRRAPRIDLLVNSSTVIACGDAHLRIVGADYPMNSYGGHMLPQAEQDAAMSAYASKAFAGVAREESVVALSHHPEFFPIAAASGAQLTLASHTHGGQVSLFGRPLIKAYDYVHGPFENGGASLDVSAGAGDWLPVRIFTPREVVIITLRQG